MLLGLPVVFFLLGWKGTLAGLPRCPPPSPPRHGAVVCLLEEVRTSCASRLPVGSVAEFTCGEFYALSPADGSPECLPNGTWSSSAPECVPDCGRRRSSVSLIVRGSAAPRGAFPWHAGIYYLTDGIYEYGCGGSLISETSVLTAAHCVWQVAPETLMLAFGKFHRDYYADDEDSQRLKARRIETLSSYQDAAGNYNGDIALIFLQEGVRVGLNSAPVCLDLGRRLMEAQLAEGTSGVVAGWGLTENDTLGDSLRAVRLPVVSDRKCISRQERDFKKFVTYTTFCAGHANGTGVCNGDSGGGLAMFDEASGRWFLQGLVSVSPRRKGTSYCDPNFYTVFTKIGAFSGWLEAMRKLDGELSTEPSRGKKGGRPAKGRKITFRHSEKLLELAGLLNATQNSPLPQQGRPH